MAKYNAKTESCIRCKEAYKKHDTGGANTYKFPAFNHGFNSGEQSMIKVHAGLVQIAREYLHIFEREDGLVNHALKRELEKIDKLLWSPNN